VHLICQDREGGEELAAAAAQAPGSVAVHVPDIAGLLPVFVKDRYEGFEVKTFSELSDAELARYVERNVDAVREVAAAAAPDAALANHLVMGGAIAARVGLRFALKVHGSDLAYTVLPDLQRFRPFAEEAVDAASGVLVGSAHIAARLREAVGARADGKLRLGPPGVDAALFAPVPREQAPARLRELAARLRELALEPAGAAQPGAQPGPAGRARLRGLGEGGAAGAAGSRAAASSWERDPAAAAAAIEWLAAAAGPRVVFVGKLILAKGVDLLLAAWPLVHARHPSARLLVAGFGGGQAALERLWETLAEGDLSQARELAARGRELEGGPAAPLPYLQAFLARLPPGYAERAREAAGSVAFAGRLEHTEVGMLVPACDALVFPSTFPEAFGMVAAEAAAAGVLPVSAAHSGAAEVSRELARGLPAEVRGLVSFPLGEGAVPAIAERVSRWLGLDEGTRERARRALRATAERLWSWEGVARGVLAASAGHLDELPRVAEMSER